MTLQKSRLMFLMELLNRETDEEHPITIAEIIDRLKAEGLSANRHTIAGDLKFYQNVFRLKPDDE